MRLISSVHGSKSLKAYLKFRKYGHIIFYLNRNDTIYDRFVFDIIILFHQKFKLIKLQKIAKKSSFKERSINIWPYIMRYLIRWKTFYANLMQIRVKLICPLNFQPRPHSRWKAKNAFWSSLYSLGSLFTYF